RVHRGLHHDGEQPVLQRIVLEDVGDGGADHGAKPIIVQRPGGVLAGRAAAEVVPGDEHGGAGGLGLVEDEVGPGLAAGVVAPVGEELLAEAGLGGDLEEAGRDDLVGVDVVDREQDGLRREGADGFHGDYPFTRVRASVTWPVTAAAAAVRGLARKVRPPAPWRPSKLRLLVLTAYWPGFN